MPLEQLEVDTKGVCLMCLRHSKSADGEATGLLEEYKTPFRMLLRYLRIDISHFANFTSSFVDTADAGLGNVEVVVSLCETCCAVTNTFGQLYQDFDDIRLQLDKCAQSLHDLICVGDNSVGRMQHFRRVMATRKPSELVNLSIAENLRRETMRKCSQRMEAAVPKVNLRRDEADFHSIPAPFTPSSPPSPMSFPPRLKRMTVTPAPPTSNVTITGFDDFEQPQVLTCEPDLPFENSENEDDESLSSPQDEMDMNISNVVSLKTETLTMDHGPGNRNVDMFWNENNDSDGGTENDDDNHITFVDAEIDDASQGQNAAENTNSCLYTEKKCDSCGAQFNTAIALERHCKQHNKGGRPFICRYCGKETARYKHHHYHMLMGHTMQVYAKCIPPGITEDRLKMALKRTLKEHKFLHKGKQVLYGCPRCPRGFNSCYYLKYHIINCHFDKVVHELKQISTSQLLSPQIRHQPPPSGIAAPRHRIGPKSKTRGLVRQAIPASPLKHQLSARKKGPDKFTGKRYNCKICEKVFSTSKMLGRHMRDVHTNEHPFTCSYCGKQTKQYDNHRSHMITVHTMQVFSKYLPPETDDRELQTAIQSILDESRVVYNANGRRFYGCSNCDRDCTTASYLRQHLIRCHFDKLVVKLQEQMRGHGRNNT